MPYVNGDSELAIANEILRSTVGSEVHGLNLPGSDRDEMGVYIEPPDSVFRPGAPPQDNVVIRTADQYERSTPDDIDLVLYSLRRYLGLAAAGNPTVLLPLFAPRESLVKTSMLGEELRGNRHMFLSRNAVRKFLGYMHQQRQRMLGLDNRHTPARPELIERYGWDVKYGSHALRIAHQGYEIASTGTLTLPVPEPLRSSILAVKRGEADRDEVAEAIVRVERLTEAALEENPAGLPEEADWDGITAWSTQAHLIHWNQRGLI